MTRLPSERAKNKVFQKLLDYQRRKPLSRLAQHCFAQRSGLGADTAASLLRAQLAEVGPTSARKANTKLREVEQTAVVFGPGAAVNESNHLALRN